MLENMRERRKWNVCESSAALVAPDKSAPDLALRESSAVEPDFNSCFVLSSDLFPV